MMADRRDVRYLVQSVGSTVQRIVLGPLVFNLGGLRQEQDHVEEVLGAGGGENVPGGEDSIVVQLGQRPEGNDFDRPLKWSEAREEGGLNGGPL